jgi:hypothetical protein
MLLQSGKTTIAITLNNKQWPNLLLAEVKVIKILDGKDGSPTILYSNTCFLVVF